MKLFSVLIGQLFVAVLFLISCSDNSQPEEVGLSGYNMLPDVFYVVAGQPATLYFNECIQGTDSGIDNTLTDYKFEIETSSESITADTEGIRINIHHDQSGEYRIKLFIYNTADELLLSKDVVVKAFVPGTFIQEKVVLMLGDSWTSINDATSGKGYVYYLNHFLAEKTGGLFRFVGSRQVANNELWHEGRGGYTYHNWLESNNNPLFNPDNKKVDLTHYRTTVLGIEKPFDIVNIQLGVNDCIRKSKATAKDIAQSVSSCISLAEAILADSPDCKIIVNAPGMDIGNYEGWVELYGNDFKKEIYQYNRWQLCMALYEELSSREDFEERVFWGQSILGLNRWTNYTNATHPNVDGYREMAYSLAPQLLHLLQSAE